MRCNLWLDLKPSVWYTIANVEETVKARDLFCDTRGMTV